MAEQQLPVWNSKGVEPPANLQRDGWQPGVKPPAQYFDWLFNRAYECLEELQTITEELEANKANGTDLTSLSNTLNQHFAAINPHSETESRTISVGNTHEFKTIQSALNSIKKNLGNRFITLSVENGTYAEDVQVSGFYNGELTITHASSTTYVNSYHIVDCWCQVTIAGGEVTKTGAYAKIAVSRCGYVSIKGVRLVTPSTGTGVVLGGCMSTIQDCAIHNQGRGIDCQSNALGYSANNSGTGNTIALVAYAGGTIAKSGMQPTGTTNESAWAGGVIR